MSAAAPHRPYGVNHPSCRQIVAPRNLCIPGRTSIKLFAFSHETGTCGFVDRAVDTAATQQRSVRGIHDRIDVKPCYIAFDDLDSWLHSLHLLGTQAAETR